MTIIIPSYAGENGINGNVYLVEFYPHGRMIMVSQVKSLTWGYSNG